MQFVQARDCQRELFRFDVKTAVDRDLLESFRYWSLHNVARFTAAQFVSINTAFLYAIFGAMSTYLLVLFQFHQQETTVGSANNITQTTYTYLMRVN